MTPPRHTDGEPHDRLTRIADAVLDAVRAHPEYRDGDRAIVLLDDGHNGGIGLGGYDEPLDALADVLTHAKALGAVRGLSVAVVPIEQVGQG
jgi:hypothetical protein